MATRIFYRKEKLRGACWEYQIEGGWIAVPTSVGARHRLHPPLTRQPPPAGGGRPPEGPPPRLRPRPEQWFFPDRWFSLLRFTTDADQTVGYYVNFSHPLSELRENYYRDLDLELDLWVEPDGTATELDRDEFLAEVAAERLTADWAAAVDDACNAVARAVAASLQEGRDIDHDRDPETRGYPAHCGGERGFRSPSPGSGCPLGGGRVPGTLWVWRG